MKVTFYFPKNKILGNVSGTIGLRPLLSSNDKRYLSTDSVLIHLWICYWEEYLLFKSRDGNWKSDAVNNKLCPQHKLLASHNLTIHLRFANFKVTEKLFLSTIQKWDKSPWNHFVNMVLLFLKKKSISVNLSGIKVTSKMFAVDWRSQFCTSDTVTSSTGKYLPLTALLSKQIMTCGNHFTG